MNNKDIEVEIDTEVVRIVGKKDQEVDMIDPLAEVDMIDLEAGTDMIGLIAEVDITDRIVDMVIEIAVRIDMIDHLRKSWKEFVRKLNLKEW